MQLNMVVLPAPLGPIRPRMEPSATSKETPSRATRVASSCSCQSPGSGRSIESSPPAALGGGGGGAGGAGGGGGGGRGVGAGLNDRGGGAEGLGGNGGEKLKKAAKLVT